MKLNFVSTKKTHKATKIMGETLSFVYLTSTPTRLCSALFARFLARCSLLLVFVGRRPWWGPVAWGSGKCGT